MFLDSSPVARLNYVIKCVPKDPDAKCMHCQDHLGTNAVVAKTCIPDGGTATDVGAMCLVHRSCFDEFVRCSGVDNGSGWRKMFVRLYLSVCVLVVAVSCAGRWDLGRQPGMLSLGSFPSFILFEAI